VGEHKPHLIDLAARVSDGARIDWDEEERSAASEDERRIVRHLRLVDSVAEVHRSQTSSESSKDPLEMSCTVASTITVAGEATIVASQAVDGAIREWGPLEIREKIGEGAFGEVFRAWDANLDREVALKLLKAEPSARASLASTVLKEGRLLARLHHPNVVTVHGAETHEERVGLWMEFVRGRSLADLLAEQGTLGAREAALIGLDLCRALAAVHGAGLVHRDIKARNVMREEGGRILLMDFGAGGDAKEVEERAAQTISGTPLYIAPEVYARQPATARSDIYSLGVLLYHLVTGSYPVQASSLGELQAKHSRREMRLLRDERSDLPEAFVNVVERALAWDPEERFATAGRMEQALAAALGVERAAATVAPTSAARGRRPFWRIAAMAALAVLAFLVFWLFPTPTPDPVVTPPQPVPWPEPPIQAPATSKAYTVEAALYRADEHGQRDRLASGERLVLGDRLSLEFEASRDLYVYVVNEDEQGRAYALFPMPNLDLTNPLPANRRHILPGSIDGEPKDWQVTTPGGREYLVVLASPERLTEFEAEMDKLPLPREGQLARGIPPAARVRLRGIGGVVDAPDRAPDGTAGRLFEMADQLAGREKVVEGAWVRRIELENPAP
jgi:serine/threonine-protein kinase